MSKKCRKCGGKAFRRINRFGYWEEYVLPRFGIFPWECVICRVKRYFRDDGKRPTSPEAAALFREAGARRATEKSHN